MTDIGAIIRPICLIIPEDKLAAFYVGRVGGAGLVGLTLTLIATGASGGMLTGGAGEVATALTAAEAAGLVAVLAGNGSAVLEVWDSSVKLAETTGGGGFGSKKSGDYSGKSYDGERHPENDFRDSKNNSTLSGHLDDHGADLGFTNEQQYLDGARDFLEKPPNSTTQSFVSSEGTYFRYDTATKEFGIMNQYGGISTYFKPKSGLDYWLDQIIKYAIK